MTGETGLLAGRRAVVTGSANGIGRAIAEHFTAQGATVVGIDREEAGSDSSVKSLIADLSDLISLPSLAGRAESVLGGVDVLVNAAGVFEPVPALELEHDSYAEILAVNLHAPVFLTRYLAAGMARRRYGRIINITSVHGEQSESLSLAYDVSKAGLNASTRTFALELAGSDVLINAIAPGFVATRMSIVRGEDELESPSFRDVYLTHRKLPVGRAAQPEEIAVHAAWLCSESNTYLTGQVVTVDGGLTAGF